MNIETLQSLFRAEVQKVRPDLNSFNNGSVLYTLGRAIAVTTLEAYKEIDRLKSSTYIFSDDFDTVNVLGNINTELRLDTGSLANGSVLVNNISPNAVELKTNAILTDSESRQQFIVKSPTSSISPLIEAVVQVESISKSFNANLPAGRALFSVDYPRLDFIVGSYRSSNQNSTRVIGGLTGGVSPETILDYRARVLNLLLNQRVGGKQVIITTIKRLNPDINLVEVVNNIAGLFTVWVSSITSTTYTDEQLSVINETIQPIIPPGVYSEVKQLSYLPIDIRLYSYDTVNPAIERRVQQVLTNYVDNIPFLGVLSLDTIKNLVTNSTGIIVKVLEPLEDITLERGQKFKLNKAEVLSEA
jgi:hypothetical protein